MSETVTQAADRMWPGITYDTAIPIDWFNQALGRDFNPGGQIVWGYPKGYLFGTPLPLTVEAVNYLIMYGGTQGDK